MQAIRNAGRIKNLQCVIDRLREPPKKRPWEKEAIEKKT